MNTKSCPTIALCLETQSPVCFIDYCNYNSSQYNYILYISVLNFHLEEKVEKKVLK